ncbi:penicillin-binding transpeptidase domain-containing protein [Pseudonocardia sp. N23]|uniref:penicillin-binding transpeptidase domain-containing protein n=1 Tax=Pseudonocardia sp. N23 TaxID=1987376 RepID=UPI00209C4CD4|nr:penicillin-binding transpeptidase domain-containing protein [Pseudonocardia sp. N23]
MTAPRRRTASPLRLGLLAGLLVIALVGASCSIFGPSGEEKAVQAYLDAWTRGDDAAAARLTDDPAAAQAALADARTALAPAGITATLGQVRTAGDNATASVDVTWDLGQDRRFGYLDEIQARSAPQAESGWLVHWTPAAIHPKLAAGQRLSLVVDTPDPAPVVDRGGTPLLAPTPVVNILLDRTAAGDLGAVTTALARALVPLVPGITAQSITDAAAAVPDGQGYSVAVLRDADYRTVKAAVHDLPGVRFATQTRLLAPSAGFGSQVLNPVRTEVAPQVSGVPGWSVQIVGGGGATIATVGEQPAKPGSTVTLSIDHAVQTAAEDAVDSLPQQVAIVALSPSTGDILAVAQNTQADAAGAIALTGRYPPGSTFKIVTATAALETLGIDANSPQPCPGTTTIDGRLVPNEDRFELGTVPLTQAFARSCNTTFSQLAAQMTADALPAAGLQLGFGADFAVPGLTTVTGSVPPAPDRVQRAEDGFGQGDVVATPFGMALVAATVAKGAPVVPQLIRGRATEVPKPATAPGQAALDQLRPMMRAVVTGGTATALARSGEVFGKTGTAEYSVNGVNRAHGWFVGYRGDVAFAVLVVDGGSSGPAVGVAQRFLAALG